MDQMQEFTMQRLRVFHLLDLIPQYIQVLKLKDLVLWQQDLKLQVEQLSKLDRFLQELQQSI